MSDHPPEDLIQEVDPEEFEQAFQEETEELLAGRLRLGLGVGILLYLAFSVLDWFARRDYWSTYLAIRIGVTSLVGALLWWQRTPTGRRHLFATSFAQILVGWLGIAAMTWVDGGFDNDYYYGNLLVLFLLGLFVPWSVKMVAGLCSVALLTYMVPNFFLHGSDQALTKFFFLTGAAILTCWAAMASVASRRKDLSQRFQLSSANDELKQLDEMKTNFFSNVSHELRTPLMLILGPLDSLIRGEYDGEQDNLLRAMNTNAHRLLRQVNQILNFAKSDRGDETVNWIPGNVASVIQDQIEAARPYAKKRDMELRMIGIDELPDNHFDPEHLETVFVNLLSNAMKFTPDGGTITIRGSADEEMITWTVEDTGCGIPAKDINKVFERFHQVDGGSKGKTRGTGLGLSLSQQLIQLHGGDIKATSVEGEGTTFTVTLPIALPEGAEAGVAEAPAPAAEESASGTSQEAKPARRTSSSTQFADLAETELKAVDEIESPEDAPLLLVVEDNPEMRAYVSNSLRKHYRVVTAEDGQYGVEAARKHRPDMIVSDVMMPRLDGFGMVEELRKDKTFENTPILMLTARTGSESVVKGLSLGAVDYVNKPFKLIELEARIAAQLRASMAEKALDERESRLVAIGQMTGTIAHDLRGPLTAVLGRIDLVRMITEAGGTLDSIEDDLASVERTVNRVAGMAQELMEFVRGGNVSIELQPGNAADFLGLIDQEMRGPLKECDVELVFEVDDRALLDVQLDSHRLQRVVENLVNNSRDAVNGMDDNDCKQIWLQGRRDGDQVLIRVADNGPGIPAELADKLFQPFATAGKANGTGLGLSIVRNLVTAHSGTIECDRSPAEGGAAFEMRLPALDSAQQADTAADEHAPELPQEGAPEAAEGKETSGDEPEGSPPLEADSAS